MKQFTTAVAEIESEDERDKKVAARVKELLAREDNTLTSEEAKAQAEEEIEEPFTEFEIDGHVCHAYAPHSGQLAYMISGLGRGQSQDARFATIINIMLECMRGEDKDYLEGRLLTRSKKDRIPVEKLEEIFEFLIEEWFARPTQQSSGSA